MSKIKEYRNRIKSVKSIKKITKTMQMIAVSKMKKAEKVAKAGKQYNRQIIELFKLISRDSSLKHNILFHGNTSGNKLIIMISPNRGFAGNLLISQMNLFKKKLKDFDGENVSVLAVGKKLRKYISSKTINALADFSDIGEIPTIQEVKAISKMILDSYISGEYNEVYILYADYVNSMIQVPTLMRLLPAYIEEVNNQDDAFGDKEFIFEPDKDALLDSLTSLYIDNTLYQLRAETVASEYAARMTAMKSATDKAEDLTYSLNLELNKLRQDLITQELGEISSATY